MMSLNFYDNFLQPFKLFGHLILEKGHNFNFNIGININDNNNIYFGIYLEIDINIIVNIVLNTNFHLYKNDLIGKEYKG